MGPKTSRAWLLQSPVIPLHALLVRGLSPAQLVSWDTERRAEGGRQTSKRPNYNDSDLFQIRIACGDRLRLMLGDPFIFRGTLRMKDSIKAFAAVYQASAFRCILTLGGIGAFQPVTMNFCYFETEMAKRVKGQRLATAGD